MAATEPKTELKTEPEEVEEDNHPVPEPLKYKTWELKVSVHCEACKRKVKKIIHKIEGVYETEIDLKQQKVTVKGNVEADTLIKRLIKKTGKHAELWPEKADKKEKKKGKSKKKKKQSNDNNNDEESSEESSHGGNHDKEAQGQEGGGGSTSSSTNIKFVEVGNAIIANNEGGGDGLPVQVKTGVSGVVQVKETKPEVKQTATLPAGNQTVAVDKKSGEENEAGGEKSSGSGSGSKKKKKKGHKAGNPNNTADNVQNCEPHASNNAPADSPSAPPPSHVPNHENGPYYHHGPGPMAAPNHSAPRYHPSAYQYPPTQYYAASPVYAVSHNTTHPSGTYAAAYSASPPQNSYAYVHPGVGNWMDQQQYQRYDLDYESSSSSSSSYASSRPSDSFELFSDENPNGCSVM